MALAANAMAMIETLTATTALLRGHGNHSGHQCDRTAMATKAIAAVTRAAKASTC